MDLSSLSFLSLGIILLAPVIAHYGIPFAILDNIFLRILLVGFVFYAIRQGPLEGLFAFLAVFSLLVERNHQTLMFLPGQAPKWPTRNQLLSNPMQAIPLTPNAESHSYEDHGNDYNIDSKFGDANDLEDNNPRLQEGPHSSSDAEYYEEKGFVN